MIQHVRLDKILLLQGINSLPKHLLHTHRLLGGYVCVCEKACFAEAGFNTQALGVQVPSAACNSLVLLALCKLVKQDWN